MALRTFGTYEAADTRHRGTCRRPPGCGLREGICVPESSRRNRTALIGVYSAMRTAVSRHNLFILAGPVLIAAWLLTLAASVIGHPEHAAVADLITAFLLWRIWRGATWSRHILIMLAAVAGGLAAGIGIAILAGATGIVASAVIALVMYAGVGVLLALPDVRRLAR
jgi:hypothetical protein